MVTDQDLIEYAATAASDKSSECTANVAPKDFESVTLVAADGQEFTFYFLTHKVYTTVVKYSGKHKRDECYEDQQALFTFRPRVQLSVDAKFFTPKVNVFILADSYAVNDALSALYGKLYDPYMDHDDSRPAPADMSPHVVEQLGSKKNRYHEAVLIHNHSKEGLRLASVTNKQENFIYALTRVMPQCVFIHLGAVDIAQNLTTNPVAGQISGSWFYDTIVSTATYIRCRGMALSRGEVPLFGQKNFKYMQSQPFVFAYLPDWGPDFVPKDNHPDPIMLRKFRTKQNRYVDRNLNILWNRYRVIMQRLPQSNPDRDGVHLAGDSQDKFAVALQRIIARHVCTNCFFPYETVKGGNVTNRQAMFMAQFLQNAPSCDRPAGNVVNAGILNKI